MELRGVLYFAEKQVDPFLELNKGRQPFGLGNTPSSLCKSRVSSSGDSGETR